MHEQQQQQSKPQGKVSKGVNIGLDTAYALIWGVLTLLSIIVMFAAPHGLWPGLAGTALFGWWTLKNVRNIVVYKGRD
jgi:hypothetical protein